jgi:hypothetical protein
MIRVSTVADLEQVDKQAAEAMQNTPVIMGLAAHLRTQWTSARNNKHNKVQYELLENLRRCNGEYQPSKLAEIRAKGGSEVFMQLTQAKKRAVKAWIKDILINSGDKPWGMDPTTVPEPPPHIDALIKQAVAKEAQIVAEQTGQVITPEMIQQRLQQIQDQIKKRTVEITKEIAKAMEDKIHDQFQEGGWEEAFDQFLDHLVTFKTAFFKGPSIRRKKKLKWNDTPGAPAWSPKVENTLVSEWSAPNPLDIYPLPHVKKIGDGGLFEKHSLNPGALAGMRGVPGYHTESIDAVLAEHGRNGLRDWLALDQERSTLEGRHNEQSYNPVNIDALQYWGQVQGSLLVEWGVPIENVPDLNDFYWSECWMIGRWVIKAQLNPDPLDRIPVWGTSFEKIPGAFWGRALSEILSDIQDICNACARAIVNNLGFASGPMVGVNSQRLAEGEDATAIYPWRVWEFLNHDGGISEPPINFFQPNLVTEQLIRVFDYFSKQADEYLGVPSYTHGENPTGGAGQTASGLSMLLGAASKVIKQVIANCDKDIITESVEYQYTHNMIHLKDMSIKGDLKVVAKGVLANFVKEQMQMRRNEFLGVTNNPVDIQIMGLPGRAVLLEEAAKALDLPVDKIIQDQNKIKSMVMNNLALMNASDQAKGGTPPAPRELDPAGNPVAGQDNALFQNQPKPTIGGM